MAEPEDLEYNKFFSSMQQKFPRLYERALELCYVICVPHSMFLGSSFKPTQAIFERHILQPSPYLKNDYESLQKPAIKVHMGEGVLFVVLPSGASFDVKVISTELFYNSNRQKCSVLSIEGFLDTPPNKAAIAEKPDSEDFFQSRSTYEENAAFVRSYFGDALRMLKDKARFFNEGYHIVRGKLHHLVDHLTGIRDEVLAVCARSPQLAPVRGDPRLPNVLAEATEIELFHHVCDKVFQAVARESEKQEEEFALALRKTAALPQQAFGITFLPGTLDFQAAATALRSVAREKAPSLKFIMLRNTITFVSEEAKRCAAPGFVLAADEMLPLLAMAVARAGCANLPAQLAYTELFGFTLSAHSSEFSYILTTLRAAVAHLQHLAAPLPLPSSPTNPSPSTVSTPAGSTGLGLFSSGATPLRGSASFGSPAGLGVLSSRPQSMPALNTPPPLSAAAVHTPHASTAKAALADREDAPRSGSVSVSASGSRPHMGDPFHPRPHQDHHQPSSHSHGAQYGSIGSISSRLGDSDGVGLSADLERVALGDQTPPSVRAGGRVPGLLASQPGSSINLRPLAAPAAMSKEQQNNFFFMHMLNTSPSS